MIWVAVDDLELTGSKLGSSGIDSVLELSALLNLDCALRDKKSGRVTVFELFTGDAVKALHRKWNQTSSIESALIQFMAGFRALKRSRTHTQKMISLLALQAVSSDFNTKVKSEVIAAVSVNHKFRLAAISEIKKTGDSILPISRVTGISMRESPGIIELFEADSEDDQKKIWCSVCDFVVERMCYCEDKMKRLELAKEDIRDFDGSVFTDYDLFVAKCHQLFATAESWYGKPLLDEFHLSEWYKVKCPVAVKDEFRDYIANEDIDEMQLNATDFELQFKKAWKRASKKGSIYVNNENSASEIRRPMSDVNANAVQMQRTNMSGQNDMQDIELTCRVCNEKFNFTGTENTQASRF